MVKLLINHGADVNVPDAIKNHTPLHIAIIRGYSTPHFPNVNIRRDIINELLIKGAKVNTIGKIKGHSPLFDAIYWERYFLSKLLLKNGADPNVKERHTKNTPLHIVCLYNKSEMLIPLLSNKANPHLKNVEEKTPLVIAKEKGLKRMICILEKAMTPEVQELIKAGDRGRVIEILSEAENSDK